MRFSHCSLSLIRCDTSRHRWICHRDDEEVQWWCKRGCESHSSDCASMANMTQWSWELSQAFPGTATTSLIIYWQKSVSKQLTAIREKSWRKVSKFIVWPSSSSYWIFLFSSLVSRSSPTWLNVSRHACKKPLIKTSLKLNTNQNSLDWWSIRSLRGEARTGTSLSVIVHEAPQKLPSNRSLISSDGTNPRREEWQPRGSQSIDSRRKAESEWSKKPRKDQVSLFWWAQWLDSVLVVILKVCWWSN